MIFFYFPGIELIYSEIFCLNLPSDGSLAPLHSGLKSDGTKLYDLKEHLSKFSFLLSLSCVKYSSFLLTSLVTYKFKSFCK